MQVSKFLTPALLFAILVHQIISGPGEDSRANLRGSLIKSAAAESYVVSTPAPAPETGNIKQLARNLDMSHAQNINAADYYYYQQQSLMKALGKGI